MQVKTLYRYEWAEGRVMDALTKPEDKPYTERYRLIADDGKVLTYNGEVIGSVIDTDTLEGWDEVEKPDETEEATEE